MMERKYATGAGNVEEELQPEAMTVQGHGLILTPSK